jgi:hypothetical protein
MEAPVCLVVRRQGLVPALERPVRPLDLGDDAASFAAATKDRCSATGSSSRRSP